MAIEYNLPVAKSIKDIPNVKYRHKFDDDYSYVLCIRYGTSGLIPTLLNCDGGCVSSSGDSLCGGYCGEESIPGTNLFVVHCMHHLEECIRNRI